VGGQRNVGLAVGGLDGEDVPGVGGDYVGGDEVDLVGAVGNVVGADGTDVGVVTLAGGAFDLDAEEVSGAFDGEVVGGVVSPGLGDAEAEFGGAGHETQLRPLAARFGVGDVDPLNWHGVLGPWAFPNFVSSFVWTIKNAAFSGPRRYFVSTSILSSWVGRTGHFGGRILCLDAVGWRELGGAGGLTGFGVLEAIGRRAA